jgi:hypothetical protein
VTAGEARDRLLRLRDRSGVGDVEPYDLEGGALGGRSRELVERGGVAAGGDDVVAAPGQYSAAWRPMPAVAPVMRIVRVLCLSLMVGSPFVLAAKIRSE